MKMKLTNQQMTSSITSKPVLVFVALVYLSSSVSAHRHQPQTAGDDLPPDRGHQHHESPNDLGRRRHHRSHPDETEDSCSAVSGDLRELLRGYQHVEVPRKKIIASVQSLCLVGGDSKSVVNVSDHLRGHHHKTLTTGTCCTQHMEGLLLDISVEEIRARVHGVNKNLKTRLNDATESFKKRINNSLSTMWQRTSASLVDTFHLPKQHVDEMISDLISSFRSHLIDDSSIAEDSFSLTLDKFFDSLFSHSYYYLLHSPIPTRVSINPEHRECTSKVRQMLTHKPFGETAYFFFSVKMSTLIARALLSTLEVAFDAVNASESIPFHDSCSRALLRMSYCSVCSGHGVVRPCLHFCQNVAAGCLANLIELESVWKDLGLTARDVISYAKSSLNFGTVAEGFSARIDQAMLNFMIGAEQFHSQVETICRNASSAAQTFQKLQPTDFEMLKAKAMQINETRYPQQPPLPQRLYKRQLPLHRTPQFNSDRHQQQMPESGKKDHYLESSFFSEMDSVFNPAQSLWGDGYIRLPDQICKTLSHSSTETQLPVEHRKGDRKHHRHPDTEMDGETFFLPVDPVQCWNGSAIGKYKRSSNINMHARNPEMQAAREPLVNAIRERIVNMSSQLFRKFMGPGLNHMSEGFGSGIGSGDDYIDNYDDNDDDDDDDNLINGIYSGYGYSSGDYDTNETIFETTQPTDRHGDFDFSESTVRVPPFTPSSTDASTTSPITKATIATIATDRPTAIATRGPGSDANSLLPGHLLLLLVSLLAAATLACDCSRQQ